jgi:hypothetical protein
MYKTKKYRTKKYRTKKYRTKKYRTKKYNKAKGLNCANNLIYLNCLDKKKRMMELKKINDDFNILKENLSNHYPGIKTRFVNTTLRHLLRQLERYFDSEDCTRIISKCSSYSKEPSEYSTRNVRIPTNIPDNERDAMVGRILANMILKTTV